ncbi:MAG: hypothetical protein JNL35_06675 [Sphingopyxis sp.]|nr:hypothetical protein [Sphingopyxis sp.]
MRAAYQGGAPGVFISGLVWLAADAARYIWGGPYAFGALFIGGMLIVPLAMLIARLFRAPKVSKGNPLNPLGFELTFPLFAGLFIAYGLLRLSPDLIDLAFAAFATIIGARYFGFATLYRERFYWLLGMALFLIGIGFAASGFLAADGARLPIHVTLAVGSAELLFAALLFTRWNAAAAT